MTPASELNILAALEEAQRVMESRLQEPPREAVLLLTPRQMAWVQERAAADGLTVDELIRRDLPFWTQVRLQAVLCGF